MRFWKTILISLLFLHAQGVFAQTAGSEGFRAFKRSTAIVLFAGIGGGILGLSTLSFYGRPEEHTENITTGALLGVLGGILYVSTSPRSEEPDSYISFGLDPFEGKNPVVGWVGRF